ncbi:uncharacterized protein PAC_17323 [Phialocephala subalpina]|uniref:2EXR domain-containing protein n=1 Tax=Phialocephala subalpina TaxID=576137 RepID=A0A1L7XQW1_9HELO|nr:uncharacterized protein PAC_17323 [Phialocephala subalpina]
MADIHQQKVTVRATGGKLYRNPVLQFGSFGLSHYEALIDADFAIRQLKYPRSGLSPLLLGAAGQSEARRNQTVLALEPVVEEMSTVFQCMNSPGAQEPPQVHFKFHESVSQLVTTDIRHDPTSYFHKFPKLPDEVGDMILDYCIPEPQLVAIQAYKNDSSTRSGLQVKTLNYAAHPFLSVSKGTRDYIRTTHYNVVLPFSNADSEAKLRLNNCDTLFFVDVEFFCNTRPCAWRIRPLAPKVTRLTLEYDFFLSRSSTIDAKALWIVKSFPNLEFIIVTEAGALSGVKWDIYSMFNSGLPLKLVHVEDSLMEVLWRQFELLDMRRRLLSDSGCEISVEYRTLEFAKE